MLSPGIFCELRKQTKRMDLKEASMRLILPVLAALLLMGCDLDDFGPSDRFKTDFHYTLKPAARLSIENFNGEIEIAGWDEPSIEITGVKYASSEENLKTTTIDIHESPEVT